MRKEVIVLIALCSAFASCTNQDSGAVQDREKLPNILMNTTITKYEKGIVAMALTINAMIGLNRMIVLSLKTEWAMRAAKP